jgi:serine O-acetyltransferase
MISEMITSKKECRFYIIADRIMNGFPPKKTLKEVLSRFLFPYERHGIIRYLYALRKYAYYKNTLHKRLPSVMALVHYKRLSEKLGCKFGFSIDANSFGYGLVIPHHGTIVVGQNTIGNYAVLNTSVCISGNDKNIGDGLFVGTGTTMTKKLILGNNVSVGANSLVNDSFCEDNIVIGGMPAHKIKGSDSWYVRDGSEYSNRVKEVERIKKEMNLK